MKRISTLLTNYQTIFTAFVMGCLVALGQAPWGFTSVAIIGLTGLFAINFFCRSNSVEKIIFMFGLGYFSLTLHWMVQPFLIEAETYMWIAPIGFLSLIFLCSSFWTLSTYFITSISGNTSSLNIAFSLTLGELIRSFFLSGFPWGLIGYIWIDTPLSQLGAWVGPIGLTGITFFLSALPFLNIKSLKPISVSILIFLLLFLSLFFRSENSERLYSNKVVRLVQPNANQENKWNPLFASEYYKTLLELSSQPLKESVDLIIWPETAIVPWLNEASEELKQIGENIPPGAELILGIRRQEKNNIYNSLVLLDHEGIVQAKYDKFHLVPFGEYMPILQTLKKQGIIYQNSYENFGFSPGKGSQVFYSNIGFIRPLICYEAIFFQEIFNKYRPNFLVNLTNDGWLGKWAGPEQHLHQVRMRAIEQGLPIIRSANTGISAIIDPYGKVVDSIEVGVEGFIDVKLPLELEITFYSRVGEYINIFLLLLWSLIILVTRNRIKD